MTHKRGAKDFFSATQRTFPVRHLAKEKRRRSSKPGQSVHRKNLKAPGMKKTFALPALSLALFACQKNNDSASQISLTPSATQVSVGQPVDISLTTTANASNWTVSPASTVTKTYGLTTSKVNSFTFSRAGVYTVSVRAKSIAYDSASQSLLAAWNAAGASRGICTKGIDTAAVAITVTGK